MFTRRRWLRRSLAVLGIVVLVAAGAGLFHSWRKGWLTEAHFRALQSCPDTSGTPVTEPSGPAEIRLATRAEGLQTPTALAFHPRLDLVFVSEQTGRILMLEGGGGGGGGRGEVNEVLDLHGRVSTLFDQGLLAVAVDPGGRYLYVYFTDLEGRPTLVAWPLDRDGRPRARSERTILTYHHDDVYHDGGGLVFDADGHLYVTMGDGGLLGDWRNRGQDLGTLLGKIVRITPTPEADEPYRVPANNPWVGDDGAAPEAFARGTRNPYRLDIDPATGDLWVADVGLNCAEEVSRIVEGRGGANLGWHHREGGLPFVRWRTPSELLEPVYWYPHDPGCAVIGGAVYRGDRFPRLDGSYLVTDYCTGRLVALTPTGDDAVEARDLGVESVAPLGLFRAPDGEMWLTNQNGEVIELVAPGPASRSPAPSAP